MLILITLAFLKERIVGKEDKIELLISNFINVGFINIERREDKLVFKGFIENEYDLYFYSLLKFIYKNDETLKRSIYSGMFKRTEIVIKKEGIQIYKSSLGIFYHDWRNFKHPELLENCLSDEEYEGYSQYCQELYEYVETHDIKKQLDEYTFKNSDD